MTGAQPLKLEAAASTYYPLIMQGDRIIRLPIEAWQQNMVRILAEALQTDAIDVGAVAATMNQLALLEAYQGNNDNASRLCGAQIDFWKGWAEKTGERKYLCLMVQPWINVIRLNRWLNNVNKSSLLYKELAPARRASPNSLSARCGNDFKFEENFVFAQGDSTESLLDNVFWSEYGRLLLTSGDYEELQRHVGLGLREKLDQHLTATLLELLFSLKCNTGKFDSVLVMLEKMNVAENSLYWLHFKVLEMYANLKLDSQRAQGLVDQVFQAVISGEHMKHGAYDLYFLFEITKIFRELGLHTQEKRILDMVVERASALNDEAVLFDALFRLSKLNAVSLSSIHDTFKESRYAFIQRALGLSKTSRTMHSPDIIAACDHLSQMETGACAEMLASLFRPASAAQIVRQEEPVKRKDLAECHLAAAK